MRIGIVGGAAPRPAVQSTARIRGDGFHGGSATVSTYACISCFSTRYFSWKRSTSSARSISISWSRGALDSAFAVIVKRSVVIQPGPPLIWYSRSPPHACVMIVRSGRLAIVRRPPPGVRRGADAARLPSSFFTDATSNRGSSSGGMPIGGGGSSKADAAAPPGGAGRAGGGGDWAGWAAGGGTEGADGAVCSPGVFDVTGAGA